MCFVQRHLNKFNKQRGEVGMEVKLQHRKKKKKLIRFSAFRHLGGIEV